MLKENLLSQIGLTPLQQQQYADYAQKVGDWAETHAFAFMRQGADFKQMLASVRQFQDETIPPHTLDMLFLFACTGYLYEDYQKKGIGEAIFVNSMCDLAYKIRECEKVKQVFGIFVAEWHEGFFRMTRFALGRLQYDLFCQREAEIDLGNYQIKRDQFALNCHIPSSGPLHKADAMRSYEMAYAFFQDRLLDGILPIFCYSWLLYPPYLPVFEQNAPNITRFVADFKVSQVDESEVFGDAWRIFNTEDLSDLTRLPQNTRLQQGFLKYMQEKGSFGSGSGVLLFDGHRVLALDAQ